MPWNLQCDKIFAFFSPSPRFSKVFIKFEVVESRSSTTGKKRIEKFNIVEQVTKNFKNNEKIDKGNDSVTVSLFFFFETQHVAFNLKQKEPQTLFFRQMLNIPKDQKTRTVQQQRSLPKRKLC